MDIAPGCWVQLEQVVGEHHVEIILGQGDDSRKGGEHAAHRHHDPGEHDGPDRHGRGPVVTIARLVRHPFFPFERLSGPGQPTRQLPGVLGNLECRDAPQAREDVQQRGRVNRNSRNPAEGRAIVTIVLVVLSSLSVVLAVVASWAHTTVLETDQFMEAVGPALEEPALYTALGDKVSTEVVTALDLETRIGDALAQVDDFLFGSLIDALDLGPRGQQILEAYNGPNLESLAPTIASGLEERITTRIQDFFASPDFGSRLPALVERAHEATIALLRDEFTEIPNVSIVDGEVQLNLIPIITEAIRQVLPDLGDLGSNINLPDRISEAVDEGRQQLADAIGAQLPDDFGQVTIMSEDRLNELQDGVVMLDRLVWLLIGLAVVLIVVTVVVSKTRRRTAIQLAIGVVIALLVAGLVLNAVQNRVIAAIDNPDGQTAAAAIMGDVFSKLWSIGAPGWIAGAHPRSRRLPRGHFLQSRRHRRDHQGLRAPRANSLTSSTSSRDTDLPLRVIPPLDGIEDREKEDRAQLGIRVGTQRAVGTTESDHLPKLLLIGVAGCDHPSSMLRVEHPGLVEIGPNDVRVGHHHTDVTGDQPVQLAGGWQFGGKCGVGRRLEQSGPLLDDLDQQILLRVDVGVERGAEQAQLPAQVAHRGPVIPLVGEEATRSRHHVLTGVADGHHQRWSYRTTTRSAVGCDLAREHITGLDLGIDEGVVLGHAHAPLLDPPLASGAHAALAREGQLGSNPEGGVEDRRVGGHQGLHGPPVEDDRQMHRPLAGQRLRRKSRNIEWAGKEQLVMNRLIDNAEPGQGLSGHGDHLIRARTGTTHRPCGRRAAGFE